MNRKYWIACALSVGAVLVLGRSVKAAGGPAQDYPDCQVFQDDTGPSFGLCIAACKAAICGDQGNATACARVKEHFFELTGMALPCDTTVTTTTTSVKTSTTDTVTTSTIKTSTTTTTDKTITTSKTTTTEVGPQ